MNRAILIAFVLTFLSIFAPNANAQMMSLNYGIGMMPGMDSCPYQYSPGEGASSNLDGIREANGKIKELKRERDKKAKELKKLERALDKARKDIEDSISYEYSDFLIDHMDNGRRCNSYEGVGERDEPIDCSEDDDASCTQNSGTESVGAYGKEEWARLCPKNGRLRATATCEFRKSRNPDSGGADCPQSLVNYGSWAAQKRRLEKQIERLENAIEDQNEEIGTFKENYLDEVQQSSTQGGICWTCLTGQNVESRGPDWTGVLTNGILGGLSMYLGYQNNKQVVKNNTAMGWPSMPYNVMQAGYPFIQNALYGALGGGIGQGTFGCGGSMNGANMFGPNGMMGPMMGMNGMMGYPGNMMGGMPGMWGNPYMMGQNPWGGGMFNPGMGPWGMNGPFSSMGWPMSNGMNFGINFGFQMPGMQMGYQMGGMPMGGFQMGGMPMGGFQMGGMPMGGFQMGGMPMGGFQMGGMPMGGFQMGGMPMGGFQMGGMPMGGFQMGGMPMGGFQLGGYQMAGLQMGGYQLGSGWQMGGMQMGGFQMGGMQMGMIDPGFQQQMMQMQQQQYQLMMQQQMRAQEAAMQRQQVVAGLQQEIQGLVYRMQQVQMGGYDSYTQGGYLNPGYSTMGTMPIDPGNGSIIQPTPTGR